MSEPVFLFSLPRSGSTLLQRLVSGHPQVATTSEPWVLLPLLYTLRRPGAYTEYGHRAAVRAIEDFTGQMRGGRDEYLFEVREFAQALYDAASNGERYFLDKTPRYHLVIDEIMELFPDGKFIFLWRQPLAVAASIIEGFGHGSWNLEKYTIDLEDGLDNMAAALRPNDPRSIMLRYEDLVVDPDAALRRVFEFLDLDPADAEGMSDDALRGRMRDRTGVNEYQTVSAEPLAKWEQTMGTMMRRRWCRRYLERLGRPRLEAMGYDYDELSRRVDALPSRPRAMASDAARRVVGRARQRAAARLIYPSSQELEKQAQSKREQMFS